MSREAFEAWHKANFKSELGYTKWSTSDDYREDEVNLMWIGWKAALEHCKQGEPVFMIIDHDTLWRQVGEAKFNETPDHQRMKLAHAMPKSDQFGNSEQLPGTQPTTDISELVQALGRIKELGNRAEFSSRNKTKHELNEIIDQMFVVANLTIAKHTVKA